MKNKKKKCNRCNKLKFLSEFFRNSCAKDGRRSLCKTCTKIQRQEYCAENEQKILTYGRKYRKKNKKKLRKSFLKREYNVNLEDYNRIFIKQKGKCALCGIHQLELNRSLCVDHCHKTGRVRGLLCGNCNVGIGLLKEDIELLRKAIKYL